MPSSSNKPSSSRPAYAPNPISIFTQNTNSSSSSYICSIATPSATAKDQLLPRPPSTTQHGTASAIPYSPTRNTNNIDYYKVATATRNYGTFSPPAPAEHKALGLGGTVNILFPLSSMVMAMLAGNRS